MPVTLRVHRLMMTATLLCLALMAGSARGTETVTEPFIGVTHLQRHDTTTFGRPVLINALRVDLRAPGIGFRVTPRMADAPVRNGIPDETITETTRAFADRVGAQAAINASFFRLEHHSRTLWTNNISLVASDGDAYSPWDDDMPQALNISADNRAGIVRPRPNRQTGFETVGDPPLWNAVAGNVDLVRDGQVLPHERLHEGSRMNALNPRTAAGVSRDGRYLFLVTADGRQPESAGLFLDEMGQLMLSFGAHDAINLDGGGSTTMTLNYYRDVDSNGMEVGSRVVNSPVGRGPVGSERNNGANLAIFARDNPAFTPPPGPVVPPPEVVMLADFETASAPFDAAIRSGSNVGVADTTTVVRTGGEALEGMWKQEIRLDRAQGEACGRLRFRHLSGGGAPANNTPLPASGHVGLFLRVAEGDVETGDFKVTLLIDDGEATERGVYRNIIADGHWHLYEWDLADPAQWENFSGGNGQIEAETVTLDAIYIDGDRAARGAVFHVDAVAHNRTGSLRILQQAAR